MEKIIDKVKKLIALGTNQGATDGERDNAIRMAHGLLAKHNLSMVNLEESVEERVKLPLDYYNAKWCGAIVMSISKLFFCSVYSAPGESVGSNAKKRTVYYFVGKESNAITASMMAHYVMKSIFSEQNKLKLGNSFSNGAANKIYQRVEAMMTAESLETSTGTGLAVVSIYKSEQQANKEFLESNGTKLVKAKTNSVKQNGKEWFQGSEFGGKINLNGQIAGDKAQAMIG